MTTPQQVEYGHNDPQFDALRPDTDLVTVGIGGKDAQVFGRIAGTCPTLRETAPKGSPRCRWHFTVDGVTADIGRIREDVTAVLREIHRRAPHAEVMAVGYPRIVPTDRYCPKSLLRRRLRMDRRRHARTQLGEARCGDGSAVRRHLPRLGSGRAWINGKDAAPSQAAPFHPFDLGMRGVTDSVARVPGH